MNSEKFDSWSPNGKKLRQIKNSETRRQKKKSRLRDAKITQNRDFKTHQKRFRGLEIVPKFPETCVFQGTILHPYKYAE